MNTVNTKNIALIFFSCILFATNSSAQNDPFNAQLTASSETGVKIDLEEIKATEIVIEKLTSYEAHQLRKDKPYNLIFLDIRPSYSEYETFHISGARWVGDDYTNENIWYLDRNATLVVYGNPDSKSYEFARRLREMGFKDVRCVEGKGLIDWINDGYSVVDINGTITNKYRFENKDYNRMLIK